MALNFELKLSFKQALLLVALAEWQKQGGKENAFPSSVVMDGMGHFVAHANALQRQGLIIYSNKGALSKERWTVTRKGELLAEVVQEEFKEIVSIQKQIANALKAKGFIE